METNETTHEPTRALARQTVDGEAWAEWMPTAQNAGVDTLEFSFDVEIGQAMWERLEEEKEVAQLLMQTRKAEHVPDWLNAVVRPVGAKGGYRFLLETPTFSIKLLKGVPNRPVEMRAYGLHTHEDGAIGACEAACAFIRDTLLAEEDPEWTAKVINLDGRGVLASTSSSTGREAGIPPSSMGMSEPSSSGSMPMSVATVSMARSTATRSGSRRSEGAFITKRSSARRSMWNGSYFAPGTERRAL